MSDEGHVFAVQALRIFAASPDQLAALCRNPPKIAGEFFFPGVPVARYLKGVGCVFTTYKNNLFDVVPDSASHLICEVAEELQGMHCVYTKKRWSLEAVGSSSFWHRLRQQSRAVLREMGEDPPKAPTLLDVEAVINVDEFYTPRERRRFLRELGL